jgi:hypothetical protein
MIPGSDSDRERASPEASGAPGAPARDRTAWRRVHALVAVAG